MPTGLATVFAGTGFLGRRIVGARLAQGRPVRVAAGRLSGTQALRGAEGRLERVAADLRDDAGVAAAVAGAGP